MFKFKAAVFKNRGKASSFPPTRRQAEQAIVIVGRVAAREGTEEESEEKTEKTVTFLPSFRLSLPRRCCLIFRETRGMPANI